VGYKEFWGEMPGELTPAAVTDRVNEDVLGNWIEREQRGYKKHDRSFVRVE
jgi:hypothetical protein